jgi:hypothetical protein
MILRYKIAPCGGPGSPANPVIARHGSQRFGAADGEQVLHQTLFRHLRAFDRQKYIGRVRHVIGEPCFYLKAHSIS